MNNRNMTLRMIVCIVAFIVSVFTKAGECTIDGIKYYYEYTIEQDINSYHLNALVKVIDGKEKAGVVRIPAYITVDDDVRLLVTVIGPSAFEGNADITRIVFSGAISHIYGSAFKNCTALEDVTVGTPSEGMLSDGLTYIEDNAFENCTSLRTIDLPNSLLRIGNTGGSSFAGCTSLTSLILPANLKSIARYTFNGCTNLANVSVNSSLNSIGDYAFNNCEALKSIDLSNGIGSIGEYAFNNCYNMKSIKFPLEGLSTIGASCFQNCSSLESIVVPGSVSSIGDYCCRGCTGLKNAVIELGSKSFLGDYLFDGCTDLVQATISCYNTLHGNVFRGCTSLKTVVLNNTTAITSSLFENCTSLESVSIPNTVMTIGAKAFMGCSHLKKITIPEGVTTLPNSVFEGCASLENISLPSGLTEIGNKSLWGCSSLSKLVLPSNLEKVRNSAFVSCRSLTSLIFPSTLTTLEPNAFYGCKGLKLIDLRAAKQLHITNTSRDSQNSNLVFRDVPESTLILMPGETFTISDPEVARICLENWDTDGDGVLSVEETMAVTDLKNVFKNNTIITNFDELKYFTGLKVINYGDFGGCSNLESIILPASLEEIGDAPFGNCNALKSIVIPASVKKIGKANIGTYLWNLESIQVEEGNTVYDSRDNCNAIIETVSNKLIAGCQSTVIPDDVTTIAASAFNTCMEKPIVIPEGVTNIEKNAFMGNHFKTIVLPSTLTSMTWAFQGCSLKMVESHIANPFALDELTFDMAANAALYVPKGTKELYEATDGWNLFAAIIEIEEETADNIINFEDEAVKQLCLANWDVNASGELSFNEAAGILNLERVFYTSNISKFQELKYFTRLKSISEYAFRESGLASVVLPPSVGSIDHGAFLGCKMTEIDIPASVTSIGENAFLRCNSLASVKVNWQEPIAIDEKAFPTRTNIVLSVPIGTKAAYQDASYWKEFKEILSIYDGASGTYSIGDENAATLTDGSNMVQKETVIPSSITIDGEEFAVTAIGENAFVNNTEMTQLTIPESISEIGQGAFAGCSALEVIYNYRKEPIPLGNVVAAARTRSADGSDVFAGVNKETCVLYVPAGSKSKYAAADGWKEFQTIKEFGVVATKPGDANNDGKVNVADIVEIVNFMKKTPSEHFNEANADVNADGDVDDEDIKAIEDYLLKVEPKTLKELKAQVNLGGDFSGHLGWYVDGEGNISSSDADAVGRICYISTSDVDIAFVGSRILVLANEDITNQHGITWGVYGEPMHLTATKEPEGLCGYNNTNTLQAFGHERKVRDASGTKVEYESGYPAACYAWNYSGAKPVGASHWFLPSFIQCKKMLTAARKSGTGQLSSGKVYWSSTDNSGNFASFYTLSQTGDNPKDYTLNLDPGYEESWKETWEEWSKFCVRACYAY